MIGVLSSSLISLLLVVGEVGFSKFLLFEDLMGVLHFRMVQMVNTAHMSPAPNRVYYLVQLVAFAYSWTSWILLLGRLNTGKPSSPTTSI